MEENFILMKELRMNLSEIYDLNTRDRRWYIDRLIKLNEEIQKDLDRDIKELERIGKK